MITKLTIDRTKWYRGKGHFSSRLLVTERTGTPNRDVGKMCCLGFLSEACGVPKRDLENVGFPSSLKSELIPEWLEEKMPDLFETVENYIGGINDKESLTDTLREERLTLEFARNGVEVEFVN